MTTFACWGVNQSLSFIQSLVWFLERDLEMCNQTVILYVLFLEYMLCFQIWIIVKIFFLAPFISLVLTCSGQEEKSNTNQP